MQSGGTGTATPAAPIGVSATDGIYPDHVAVSWTGSPGATLYEVWVATSNNSSVANRVSTGSALNYDDYAAVAGTTYYYWITAKNNTGTSGFSAPDSGNRSTVNPVPAAPIGVSATDGIYTDHVAVSWTGSPGATLYEVWVATSNNSSVANRVSTGSALNYDDYAAVAGTTYYYWITAKNSAGTSGFSAPDSGNRSTANPVPAAPIGVSATDGIYPDHVAVSWTGSPNATLYEVWVATSNNSSVANRVSTGSALNYDDYAAVAGTTYYYWITAKNNTGTSGFSASDGGYRAISLPVPADTTPPTVLILSPVNNTIFNSAGLNVSGTAGDSGNPSSGVSLVQVQVNGTGGTWQTASGTANWSASVSLSSGANTIYVRSQDGAGNYSTITYVSVTLGSSCTYSLSPTSASPGSDPGSGSFSVTAGVGCSWSASTAYSWIHTSTSGSGNGTVNYTVDAKPAAVRVQATSRPVDRRLRLRKQVLALSQT